MTFCEANVINLNDISKCSIRINSILHKFTNYSYWRIQQASANLQQVIAKLINWS